jgi:hypothetical protein
MRTRGQIRLVAALLAGLVTSCGSLVEPFEGVPRPAPEGVTEAGERVAVCYNKLFASVDQVRAVALEACGPKTVPQLVDQDLRLSCPLLTPVRANFVCAPE